MHQQPPPYGQHYQQPQYGQQGYQQPQPQLYIPGSVADKLPAMVRNELALMPAQKQQEFLEEFNRNKKSVGFAYLLWLFLGWHYAYQRKWGIQVLYWLSAGGIGIWAFIDVFRVPGMIRGYNKDRAIDVMRNLVTISRLR